MSQYDFGVINPATTSGTDLAALLGNFRDALNSGHLGAGRPPYAEAGTTWIQASGNIWKVNVFDGTNDITLFEINIATNALSSPIFNAALYLLKTGGIMTGPLSFGTNGLGIEPVTGSYGSVQSKGTKGSWSGYSILGKVVLMARSDQPQFGLYDDKNNKWVIQANENGRVALFYNGAVNLETDSEGVVAHGRLHVSDRVGANRAVGNWLATKAEAEAGINGDQIMTPLRTADSIAANQAVRAWVNFNGTGTPTIRASQNVTSLTDNGTGDYSVNFVTPFSDTNYTMHSGAVRASDGTIGMAGLVGGYNSALVGKLTGSCRIRTGSTTSVGLADLQNVYVAFIA
ncbi:Putative tail fiber protein [Tritonibacter mobilis]|uniref:hypothetical protein n=1 Tax=Tritonibacter mobilis TaxID=379347 RepID=UPI000F6B3330|nr:hypothetical protein [Tritonibacter mobilis]VCU58281.1 Putative tail fiber protein [Tritonibacter mobilis]